jgi:hypothetical protein
MMAAACLAAAVLAGCGGVSTVDNPGAAASTDLSDASKSGSSSSSSSGSSSSTSSGASSSSSSSSGSTSSSSSSSSSSSGSSAAAGSGPAARLAHKLGAPSRLLIGLGAQGDTLTQTDILSENLHVDIEESYLVGAGSGDWTTWNSPAGYYVQVLAQKAAAVHAIPMYTLYQMAQDGATNLTKLSSASFMSVYWSNARLMFQQIAVSGKPALVNIEPDFWGYSEEQSHGDPTSFYADVQINSDCSSIGNNVAGIAQCLIIMARKYAPLAYVGFPPSDWAAVTDAEVVSYMNAVGAQNADFIVEQTLDRDAGCYEAGASYCTGGVPIKYWDETNTTHPNFNDYMVEVQAYHAGIGNLPVVLWQTPEGVPSSTPGGSPYQYRDNRVHYFLTHPSELTAVGVLGVVFGDGEGHQTNVASDGGQFQELSGQYLAAPAALP